MNGSLGKPRTLCGCALIPQKDTIIILRERARIPVRTPLPSDTPVMWDGRFSIALKTKGNFFISPLTPADWQALRREHPSLRNPFRPKAVLYTLPALKALSPRGIEIILAVPHIDWYGDKALKKPLDVTFTPVFPLIKKPFTYWDA